MDATLTSVYRNQYSRLLALLVHKFGDLELAEDVAHDAMVVACETWTHAGVPDNPLAWLVTVAKNRALDRLRRDQTAARRIAQLYEPVPSLGVGEADFLDERLAMLMGCCHPDVKPADRVALMLRFVGGLNTTEVAHALLLPVPTIQARITRAKKRIQSKGISLAVPETAECLRRMPLVLQAIAVIFTTGYTATTHESVIRQELTAEAIYLARLMVKLFPNEAEPAGLLALLLLVDARRPARLDAVGVPIALKNQDRSLWRSEHIAEGIKIIEKAAQRPSAGRWVIQAAIAACHAEAASFEHTDWQQIVRLYDLLLTVDDSPMVRLNRAIAVGQYLGLEQGLEQLNALAQCPQMARYHSFHIARAITLADLGQTARAKDAYLEALELVDNAGERQLLEKMLADLG